MRRFLLLLWLGATMLVAGACEKQPSGSPLIQAARTGSLDAITRLLDSGADVNLPGPTGDDWDATPLQHAILARQAGAVRRLPRRHGAGAARARSRASLTAQFRREERDLVGARPDVWGRAEIDWRVADDAWNNAGSEENLAR